MLPVRYVRDHPGALVHQDLKRLGPVPDGGGHRLARPGGSRDNRTRSDTTTSRSRIDDASRVAYVAAVPDEEGRQRGQFIEEAVGFFAGHGVRVERVMTDNGWTYTHSPVLAAAPRGPRHPPRTDPAPAAADQRQGRAVHRDAFLASGRTPAVPLEPRAPGDVCPDWSTPYNNTRPHTGARQPPTRSQARQQPRWEQQLGR